MNCKYCDTPLVDGQMACPTCGRGPEDGKPPDTPPEKPHLPKNKKQRAIFWGVLALLVVVVGAIFWQSYRGGGPAARQMQEEVIVCDDFKLTNTELGYYFWSEYFYFVDSYGDYLPASLDPGKPLAEQMYDEQTTWYDYILERAMETARNTMVMVFEAEKAGFTLDATYEASLRTVLSDFAANAEAEGFLTESGKPDVQAYLADSYGDGASVESFQRYLQYSYLAAAYSDELLYGPALTDGQISDYYDQHAGSYEKDGLKKEDTLLRSVRTVLIAPKNTADEADWQSAKESAENLHAAWLADSGTQDDFSALAAAHSADVQTSTLGGLREEVSRSDLTSELADWTFATERKPGDSAVCRTDAGWAITYFVGVSDQSAWQKQAEQDLRGELYRSAVRAATDQYEFLVDNKAVKIATPSGLYSGGTEKAAQTPGND